MTVSLEELDVEAVQYDNSEELGRIISDYLRTLSDKQQFMFIGRFYIADSVVNIANDLGVTASSVYKELEKIKSGLKIHLERNGVYV